MKKRIISLYLCLALSFSSLGARIFFISAKADNYAATQNTMRSITLSATRGNIYDTSLKPFTNTKAQYIACIKPTAEAFTKLKKLENNKEIEAELKKGHLVTAAVPYKTFFEDNNSILTLTTFERYEDNTLCHITGYCKGNTGIYGLEKYYNDFLTEASGSLRIKYHCDALGRVLNGEKTEINNANYNNPAGIILTIDKDIQKIAEKALIHHNITSGCAVVLNAKNGEILACASTPTIDRNNLNNTLKSPYSPFLNKAFTAYPVGSVFKIVTASAMLESNQEELIFTCNGNILKSSNTFYCNKRDGHGEIDLKTAISVSCNPYFIELSCKVGKEKLLATAKSLGFNKSVDFGNGFMTDEGHLPEITELNSDAAIGNFGFGQGSLLATPLQLASCYSVIANGGIYYEPSLIKGFMDHKGKISYKNKKKGVRALKASTCNTVKECLLETVKSGTGKPAFTSLFNSCGKTATAESGIYNENAEEIKYTWFAGFFPYDNPQYTICIMKENGASGSSDDAPVFKEISENIYILNRTR